MRISYNWLKEYLNFNTSLAETDSLLTNCGLEVESMEEFSSVKGGLKGLVVGEVITCEKHPSADRLSLTTVNIGTEENKKIVCGAPNVRVGQKVVVAPVGAMVHPVSGASFEIKTAKIRGEFSEGMICAEDEIGLGTSHEGVLVLKADAKVGTLVSEYFNVTSDYIFEIGLTPNRSDAASHYGVARDLYACLITSASPMEKGTPALPSVEKFSVDNKDVLISVEVKDAIACPRYCGITISGITVAPSPKWLQDRLISIGIHPTNNIVDITNFVLHECGQPLHALDADKISGNKIVVQKMKEGTLFKTLDEKERKLSSADLMICDLQKPLCIAGIFGGAESGIVEKTNNIFLESAYFSPEGIRKSVRHHDLHTDASFRFERGADVSMTLYALKRAALLMREIAGGRISSDVIEVYPNPIPKKIIKLNYEYLNSLSGCIIEKETVKNILESLGFVTKENDVSSITVEVPHHKTDVVLPADLAEEILRIYGYDKIPLSKKITYSFSEQHSPESDNEKSIIKQYLASAGFSEIVTTSLTSSQQAGKVSGESVLIHLLNPLSAGLDVMRTDMFLTGLESVSYNLNRQQHDLKFFEFGKTYSRRAGAYDEVNHLVVYITGSKNPHRWNSPPAPADFFHLKAAVQNIFIRLGVEIDSEKYNTESFSDKIFSYGIKISLGKNLLASFGSLNKSVLKQFDINAPVLYADIYWNQLSEIASKHSVSFGELPRFPQVKRDISMFVDKQTSFDAIRSLAYQTEKNLLRDVNLFDLYEGENIPGGKKSCALSFILRDDSKTLTDAEIDSVVKKLISAYEKKLGAVVRQ
ncbi:MAG: phenylalanine--tRNA ligase subunit beta [Bacteroidia bacterium]|nr:phenylalanine--tRNA ligase subunit beta [Bacteroidia bacterium]